MRDSDKQRIQFTASWTQSPELVHAIVERLFGPGVVRERVDDADEDLHVAMENRMHATWIVEVCVHELPSALYMLKLLFYDVEEVEGLRVDV